MKSLYEMVASQSTMIGLYLVLVGVGVGGVLWRHRMAQGTIGEDPLIEPLLTLRGELQKILAPYGFRAGRPITVKKSGSEVAGRTGNARETDQLVRHWFVELQPERPFVPAPVLRGMSPEMITACFCFYRGRSYDNPYQKGFRFWQEFAAKGTDQPERTPAAYLYAFYALWQTATPGVSAEVWLGAVARATPIQEWLSQSGTDQFTAVLRDLAARLALPGAATMTPTTLQKPWSSMEVHPLILEDPYDGAG